MTVQIKNNASSTLASPITTTSTSLILTTGAGALFPLLATGQWFWGTLTNSSAAVEVVKVTAVSGDTMTIVRGQDGTTALAWNSGDVFELRPTAALFNDKSDVVAAGTNAITETYTTAPAKATPADLDILPLGDSAAGFSLAQLSWGNLKSSLVAYLSALTSTWGISITGNAATATNLVGIGNASAFDLRYGPLKINTLSANTTLDATYQGSVNNITAITTQTLPALSTLTSGQTYVIDFESQVINAPVACNSADTMTVNGITGITSFPMNPGSYLRCVGVGGTAGAWICKYIPAAEVFVNNSATDIVLHVGEKCRYAPSAVANLPLNIACNTLQRYRFEITSTASGQAVSVQLQVNNTNYTGAYFYTYVWVKSDSTFAGSWSSSTQAITFSVSMLTAQDCNAIVCTDTAAKRCTATMAQSDGTTSYAGTIFSTSNDATTVWTSLGTILNCPSGNVFVERIA